jgi:DNA-binding MarR family transcriptional regulator
MSLLPSTRIMRILHELMRIDPEMPLHHAALFLTIARDEGMNLTELAQLTGKGRSVVGRTCLKLCDVTEDGHVGLGLIRISKSLRDQRERHVSLTMKGREVLAAMAGNLKE